MGWWELVTKHFFPFTLKRPFLIIVSELRFRGLRGYVILAVGVWVLADICVTQAVEDSGEAFEEEQKQM